MRARDTVAGRRLAALLPSALTVAALIAPAALATPPDAELVTVADTSFAATWTTSEPSDTTVCVDARPCDRQGESTRFHYAEISGLQPGTPHSYSLRSGGVAQAPSPTNPGSFTTLLPPPGRHLFDFALVSDVHIGEACSGTAVTAPAPVGSVPPCFSSGAGEPPYALAMTAAAVGELNARGIGLSLLNADNTSHAEFDQVMELKDAFDGLAGEWHAARGAHDRAGQNRGETRCGEDQDCFRTVLFPDRPAGRIFYSFDWRGYHFVALDSARPGDGTGDLADPGQNAFLEHDLEEARRAGKRTFIFFHHPVSEYANTTSFPPVVFGVRPDLGRQEFLALMARFPNVVGVLNSHTHRNYVSYSPSTGFELPYIENGAAKEYPGGFGLFRVYEGGYMRTFHRLRCAYCRSWTSRTRDEYFGLYPQYTLGTLSARNFTHVYGCQAATPPPSPPFGNESFIGGDTARPAACRPSGGGSGEPAGAGETAGRCRVPRSLRVRRGRIGRFRVGDSRRRIGSLAGRPGRRGRRSLRYCVGGGGRLLVALTGRNRSALIATTARGHAARGVRRGSSLRALRRAYPSARRVTRRLWQDGSTGILFGVKSGRVRFVAVVDRRLFGERRSLERHLRAIRL
jgi:hypothetical protein